MRIADILSKLATADATIIDRTAPSSRLSPYFELPGGAALPVSAEPSGDGPAIVVQELVVGDAYDADQLERLAELMTGRPVKAFVLFADSADSFVAQALVTAACERQLEIASLHETDHRLFRFAAVLTPSPDDESRLLRAKNEYRMGRLLLSLRDRAIESLETRLAEVTKQLRNSRSALTRSNQERDQARTREATEKKRAEAFEKHLEVTRKKMVAARKSVSFRVGRATKVAWSEGRKKPLALPKRWLSAFRERSEVPPGMPTLRIPVPQARLAPDDAEQVATERENLLLGLAPLAKPAPGIAGVVGPRLAAELSAATRFRPLTPNAWRYLLEVERPAFVLVTSDGLEAGTPWGNFGSPNGRGPDSALVDLCSRCALAQIPIIFWDTGGAGAHRLGLPRGVRFDALYSVSPRQCGERITPQMPSVEHLGPATEATWHAPIGRIPSAPTGVLFAGAFDRRGDAASLAALEALLVAANDADLPLEILDPQHNHVGPGASSFALPAFVADRAAPRPAPEAVAARASELGIVVCAAPCRDPDFVPWSVIRAIACGADVAAGFTVSDEGLRVADAATHPNAELRIAELAGRQRLGESWHRAYDRVLRDYALRTRLETMSRRVGAPAVVAPEPKLALVGRVASDEELESLRAFLAAQTTPPSALHVVAGADIDIAAGLSRAIGPSRLSVAAADDNRGIGAVSSDVTHLLCWHAELPTHAAAVSDLLSLARMSEASLVGLDPNSDAGPTYHYGDLHDHSIVAIRRDVASDRIGTGDPLLAARAMVAEGAKLLAKRGGLS